MKTVSGNTQKSKMKKAKLGSTSIWKKSRSTGKNFPSATYLNTTNNEKIRFCCLSSREKSSDCCKLMASCFSSEISTSSTFFFQQTSISWPLKPNMSSWNRWSKYTKSSKPSRQVRECSIMKSFLITSSSRCNKNTIPCSIFCMKRAFFSIHPYIESASNNWIS